jgi:prepilin-type N-terminal cleavage/methylation domain-containing protein/prepilin-type processing-associated H-X9-DG protein
MARLTRGFTLIELLIAATVGSFALGMLLPAIQKLRADDARAKCAANMKQLGKAALSYETTHGGLPYEAITKNNLTKPYIPYAKDASAEAGKVSGTLGRSSSLVHLLPHLEKNDITEKYTFARDYSDPVNAKALKIDFAAFHCPATPHTDEKLPDDESTYITPGNDAFAPPKELRSKTNILGEQVYPTKKVTVSGWAADYASFTRVKLIVDAKGAEIGYANPLVAAAYPPNTLPSHGAMTVNATSKLTEITDGASTTILYSEAAGRSLQCYADGKCGALDPTSITGPIWADSDNRITLTGTDPTGKKDFGTGKCAVNCNNLQGDPYSFHTGGVNMVFADGSVRFVKQTVSIEVLAALVTRAGGEKIDPNSY